MLILSLRNNDSTIRHGEATWHAGGIDTPALPLDRVREQIDGRRVCALIHGYQVRDALDVYSRIAWQLREEYDAFVGVTWPGSCIAVGFWSARWRAKESGKRFAAAFAELDPRRLDLQSHSLGARVAVEAAQSLDCSLILSAAAISHKEWLPRRALVAHSRHDGVLRGAYRLAVWDQAMGLHGPRRPAEGVRVVDCASDVKAHGDYKRSSIYLAAWREFSQGAP